MAPIDWTQVLVVVLPYVVGHAFGALQMWLRMRHDARLGRSLRPPLDPHWNPKASQLGNPSEPPTNPRHRKPPSLDS